MNEDPSQRCAEARERAAACIAERGNELERLRARALLHELPAGAVAAWLAERGALDSVSLDEIVVALGVLDDLDQLGGSVLETRVPALVARLGEDGSFGDAGASLEERILKTGMIGGHLTKSLMLRPRLQRAIDGFLCRTWDPERVKTGACEPIAAYAHWFSLNDSELSDPVLQWCGRELERGFRTRHFDALATGRVFVLCHASALPGTSLAGYEVCEAILNEQTEDGGFALSARALAGDPVGAALDGLTILARFGPGSRR